MKPKILYVERQPSAAVSIEKVFRQIAKNLSKEKFVTAFQQLPYANDTLGTLKNLLFFKKAKADIYHVTGHVHYIALILPKKRTILTIHDAGILHIRKGLRRFILKKLLFDLPIKKLEYVTAVSETTKNELVKYTNCAEEKIRVIENPLQEHFFATGQKDFNKNAPLILQIGTTANKNLSNLAAALEGVDCRLRIIGEIGIELKRLFEEKGISYETASNLDDAAIRNEYAGADLVVFCSTFEGFGLPIIEAQSMRVPVVTSDRSPMKEVAGSGAALTDPDDFTSIRAGILKVINDKEYRENLISQGIENVKRFRPDKIAARYGELYQEVWETYTGEQS